MPRTPEVCLPEFCPQETIDGLPFVRLTVTLLRLSTFNDSLVTKGSAAILSEGLTDQAGAVIPGANIAVIDVMQGFARPATTNAIGSLPGLSTAEDPINLVSIDALQEFKIQTSIYAAEFGRTPPAHGKTVTRAGTYEFHGTAFDWFRNEVFDTADLCRNGNRKPQCCCALFSSNWESSSAHQSDLYRGECNVEHS